MITEYPYLDPEKADPRDLSLDRLEQIAEAAGHGTKKHPFIMKPMWFSLHNNVRPSYDVHFIQTFNPHLVKYLIKRLKEAEANA